MSEAEAEKTGKQRFCERGLGLQGSNMLYLYGRRNIRSSAAAAAL